MKQVSQTKGEKGEKPQMKYRIAFAGITIFLMLTLVLPMHSLMEKSNATGLTSAPPITWDRTYGGALPDWGYSVVQTTDGGYSIAASTGYSGESDFWLIKTDSQGFMEWSQTYGGTYDEVARSVVQTSDGGYALAGYEESFEPYAGLPDVWLLVKVAAEPYDVTVDAYCSTEGGSVSVSITMDGSPTGYDTPHTFTGLTGSHTFTIPNADINGDPFNRWSTGNKSVTITINSGGTYTAYFGLRGQGGGAGRTRR